MESIIIDVFNRKKKKVANLKPWACPSAVGGYEPICMNASRD